MVAAAVSWLISALYSGRDGHYIPHPRLRDEVGPAAEYQPGLHDPESRQAALPRPHRHPPGHRQVHFPHRKNFHRKLCF